MNSMSNIAADNVLYIRWCDPRLISDPDVLASFRSIINEQERCKIARFIRASSQHTSLITRALVRYSLSELNPLVAPHQWQFSFGDKGKPAIVMGNPAYNRLFNVSHTCGLVIFAAMNAMNSGSLGIDAEYVNYTNIKRLGVAKAVLTEAENWHLASLDESARVVKFYEYWTLKEAFLKALGTGLSISPKSISFEWNELGVPMLDASELGINGEEWCFKQYSINGAQVAVAWRCSNAPEIELEDVTGQLNSIFNRNSG